MTINTTVIYAIRILGYMCEKKNCLVKAKELVKETGISEQYCFKVMNIIRHADWWNPSRDAGADSVWRKTRAKFPCMM